jgi:transposase-like protein
MAKKSPTKKRAAKKPVAGAAKAAEDFTAEQILELWKKGAKRGLGGKTFKKEVNTEFEPKLLTAIKNKLATGSKFGSADKKQTLHLAKALGTICQIITNDTEISKDTFEKVFSLIKTSDICPIGGGGGAWCNI